MKNKLELFRELLNQSENIIKNAQESIVLIDLKFNDPRIFESYVKDAVIYFLVVLFVFIKFLTNY